MTFAIAFTVYTLLIVGVGVYSARYAKRSNEDYFLAGRSLGPWVASLSASASSESGWVTLGLVGWAFTEGVSAYWIIPGCLLGFIFNWFVIAGRMRDHSARVNALTLPDFFAHSFRERIPILRLLTVLVILTAMWLYVAAQFAAAGKAFGAAFDNLNYTWGVVIGAGIVLVYTVLGGFRAACWTDFLQALLMVGTLIAFPIYLLVKVGGYDWILANIDPLSPTMTSFIPVQTEDETAPKAAAILIGFLLGHGALGINFGYPGQPHVLVRFMALRQRREAIIGGVIAVVWAGLIYWGAVTIGLIVRAMSVDDFAWTAQLAGDQGETGLVLAARHMIPGVLSGMVLAAVLAAICSTADSQLVVAASSAANDVYARLINRKRALGHMLVNRGVLLLLGLAAFAVVLNEKVRVYEFVLTYGWAVLGGAFGPQVILLLLWKRASYAGCVAGMLTGFLVAVLWPQIYNESATGVHIYNLPLAFLCALLVNVVVSLLVPRRPAETGVAAEASR